MVAPKAKDRDPDMAATRTDGMNHSSMNIDPSSDQKPGARAAPVKAGYDADSRVQSGSTTFAR